MSEHDSTTFPLIDPSRPPFTLDEVQDRLAIWGKRTFPNGTFTGRLAHITEELTELHESRDPREAADILILLLHIASEDLGVSLWDTLLEKLDIIQYRVYTEPDERGVVNHDRTIPDRASRKEGSSDDLW